MENKIRLEISTDYNSLELEMSINTHFGDRGSVKSGQDIWKMNYDFIRSTHELAAKHQISAGKFILWGGQFAIQWTMTPAKCFSFTPDANRLDVWPIGDGRISGEFHLEQLSKAQHSEDVTANTLFNYIFHFPSEWKSATEMAQRKINSV